MVKGMTSRDMIRLLLDLGWVEVRSKGSHHTWKCPTGQHQATIPLGHPSISAGVVRSTQRRVEGCDCGQKEEDL